MKYCDILFLSHFVPHTAKPARGMGAATVAVGPSRGKMSSLLG